MNETDKVAADVAADIDRQILNLLTQRMKLKFPTDEQRSGFSANVETLLASEEVNQLQLLMPEPVVDSIVRMLVGATRFSNPQRPVAAYLGPPYSYSHLVALNYFSNAADLRAVQTIGTVFDDVVAGRSEFGIVPIENSTDGRVVDTLASFADSPLNICGEVLLPIHHCLLCSGDIAQIQTVQSKPQALSQCRKWLAVHLASAQVAEVSSTAAAAQAASTNSTIAAIASYEAGLHYGLNVVAKNIEDSANNVTRFAIIGRHQPAPTEQDKTSIMFQIPHRSGALADAMQTFQQHDINLTWIESFPIRGKSTEYLFFVELEGHRASKAVAAALAQLAAQTLRFECLGSYPKASSVGSALIGI